MRLTASLKFAQTAAIPRPRGLPLIGTALHLLAAGSTPHLHHYVDRRHRQLGPIFAEALGPIDALFVADPRAMRALFAHEGRHPVHALPDAWTAYNRIYGCRRGLFFMDGERWAHHRKIMNKLLLKGDLAWITASCRRSSDELVGYLDEKNGAEVDIDGVLYRWSLQVIISILVGADNKTDAGNPDLHGLAHKIRQVFETSAKLMLIPASLASTLKIPAWRRFVAAVDDALSTTSALIDHLAPSAGPDGLLAKLQAEDIAPDDVKRIIVDLILAAGDTTAYAMQWLLYCLGRDDDAQEDVRQHPEMGRWALKEALRLYPVAPFLTRILPKSATIGGYAVAAGTVAVMSIYSSGRDERWYKRAEAFEPRRWDRSNAEYTARMQEASLPFAMGLRSCVGRKIAEVQLEEAMAAILGRFKVRVCNEREVGVVLKMVAVPSEPIRFRFCRV